MCAKCVCKITVLNFYLYCSEYAFIFNFFIPAKMPLVDIKRDLLCEFLEEKAVQYNARIMDVGIYFFNLIINSNSASQQLCGFGKIP